MSIDLLQRALDYVRFYNPEKDQEIRAKLFEDLKAAIEQIHTSVSANTHQQPVAWAVELPNGTRKPLYTHPARQPLTDKQINAIFWSAIEHYKGHDRWIQITRAIEAAHGIGEKK